MENSGWLILWRFGKKPKPKKPMSAIWYSLTAKTLIFKSSFEIGIKVMPGRLSTLQRRQQIFLG